MASKLVAFRLPDDLVKAIESEAQATGRDKTAVVVNALRTVFELQVSPASPSSRTIETLQTQVDALEQRVNILTEQLTRLTDTFLSTEAVR